MIKKADFPKAGLTAEGMQVLKLPQRHEFCDISINVPYAEKDGRELHLEILTPPGVFSVDLTAERTQDTFPLVIYCVGSAWREQNMGNMISRLEPFCRRGYVVALMEYRPSSVAPFPAQIKDMKTAVRFMQAHAKDYAADPERIYIWGDSSGGHTVTMVNATWDNPEFNDETGPMNIKACVDFYGPSDLTRMNDVPTILDHMSPDSAEGLFIGGRDVAKSREWTDRVNPINYIRSDVALRPQLIFHGDKDRMVPFEQSVLLYEKMRDAGQEVGFYCLEDADHAEDVFFQDTVLDIIDTFFKQNC